MVQELKIFYVSKTGDPMAVINTIIKNSLSLRKWQRIKPGCISIPLTCEEISALKKDGCEVIEATDKEPIPQLTY
jgi:hypothetical protein